MPLIPLLHAFENSHISMEQVLHDTEAAIDVSDDEEEEVVDSIFAMTSSLASVAVPFAMEEGIVETVEGDKDVKEGSFKTPPEMFDREAF